MALPSDPNDRERFTQQFLAGSWVRSYAFTDTAGQHRMYYCLQPGRVGVFYAHNRGSMSTVVVDLNSKMVMFVSEISNADTTVLEHSHPHVATSFPDTISFLELESAKLQLGSVIAGIQNYMEEVNECRRKNRQPPNILAPFVNADVGAVASHTKFAYIRRAYPHPDNRVIVFRLSNRRTQVLIPENSSFEIRWMSDRAGTVGVKYYVESNGKAEPFKVDRTGTIDIVEDMLTNIYTTRQQPPQQ